MTEASSPTGVDERIDAISSGPGGAVAVVAEDARRGSDPTVDVDRWATLARRAAEHLDAVGEITVTFVDEDEMTDLNATHMGVDAPTDVLSFPLDDVVEANDVVGANKADTVAYGADVPPRLIGDIVICPSVAAAAATHHAGTYDDELALLVVHGVLHLLGYDHAHPDDTASMRAQEMTILTTYHWQGPAPTGFRQDHADADGDAPDGKQRR